MLAVAIAALTALSAPAHAQDEVAGTEVRGTLKAQEADGTEDGERTASEAAETAPSSAAGEDPK